MKKIKNNMIIVVIVLVLSLVSCDKKTNNNNKTEETVPPTQVADNQTQEPDFTEIPDNTAEVKETVTPTNKTTSAQTTEPTKAPTTKPTVTSTPEPIQETEDVDLYSFSDEEIAEMAHMYVGCPHNYDNGPDYYMTIEKITKTNAKITLNYVGRNGSPLYEASDIDVKLSWGNSEKSVLVGSFDWNDSWGNAGTGTIMIEKDPFAEPFISLNVKQTYTAETNRATLDTKGDKTFVTYFYHG